MWARRKQIVGSMRGWSFARRANKRTMRQKRMHSPTISRTFVKKDEIGKKIAR